MLHTNEAYVDLMLGLKPCKMEVCIQIGKNVKFNNLTTGEEQRFKMTTSIGTPVKVLKLNKNDWYLIQ